MGRSSRRSGSMDKTAMDALNNGWALGIGTRVRRLDADFEAALQ